MARKRTAGKNSVGKAELGKSGRAIKQAAPSFPAARLRSIILQECSAKRAKTGLTDKKNKVRVGLLKAEIGRPTKELHQCTITLNFSLKVSSEQGQNLENPLLEITACYVILYDLDSIEGVNDDKLMTFGKVRGMIVAWPYWREFVHSMTGRLSIPPVVLPSYPVDEQIEA
jgi:hypothetical protein